MDLHRIKELKCLRWPWEINHLSKDLAERLNARGRQSYQFNNPTFRSQEAGFVVDLDSPGETFFCRDDARNLEPVPRDEYDAALKKLKEQGPITFQPALDWLEEKGLREASARPKEDDAERKKQVETEDGEAISGIPLGKLKLDELKHICDALSLAHGKVAEMRAAIAEELDCDLEGIPVLLEDGSVGLLETVDEDEQVEA